MQDVANPASLKMKSVYYLYRLDIYIFMGLTPKIIRQPSWPSILALLVLILDIESGILRGVELSLSPPEKRRIIDLEL